VQGLIYIPRIKAEGDRIMAAFQGWGSGPNFAPAAAAMTQATQIEEQRRARQSEQIRSAFEGLRDARRRREDQAIAADTAKQAQKNTEATRAINLYTAISNQSNQLQLREPKQSDFLLNPDAYGPALETWKNAVDRNQAQLRELEANNPNLRAMLGAQGGGANPNTPTYMMQKAQNASAPVATGIITNTDLETEVQPDVASNTNNNNLEFGGNAQTNTATTQDSSGNIFDRTGRYIGRALADLTLPYDPNADPSNPDERGFFQKAKDLGYDAKSLYTMLEDRAQKQMLGPEVGQEVGLGTDDDDVVTTPGETPANLSGEEARGDTPESTRRAIQDTIFNAIEQSRIDLGDMADGVYDAITTGIDKVIPDGLERRIDAFGKSNLGDREHAQEVITLEEIAKESAKGAVAGIAGGMAVVLGLTALRTIRPGQRQVVAETKKRYAALLQRIREAAKLRAARKEYQKKADKVAKARAAREAAKKAKENAERKAREKANKRGQATPNSKVRPKDFLPGNRVNSNFMGR